VRVRVRGGGWQGVGMGSDARVFRLSVSRTGPWPSQATGSKGVAPVHRGEGHGRVQRVVVLRFTGLFREGTSMSIDI